MADVIPIIDDIPHAQATVLRRAAWDEQQLPAAMLDGIERIFGERLTPEQAVAAILRDVRQRGDDALREWSQRIDGPLPGGSSSAAYRDPLAVPQAEIDAAVASLHPALLDALQLAAERLEAFHRKQPAGSWMDVTPGGTLGQIVRPLERVGVYVPAGTSPLPSSLLHAAIPARVAGVAEIVVCTPPSHPITQSPNYPSVSSLGVAPLTLAAAHVAGVDAVYALGGAQAIAAMAYGTESVPRVDKIVGPGGLFVTLAKRQVFGAVGIDGLPGPTETLVIADDSADPTVAAADLLAQAEHDVLASAILLTPSRRLAELVQVEVARQLEALSRADIAATSLAGRGAIVVTASLEQAVALANAYAPEHLCLLTADPWALVGKVENAGGIFVGEHSFEVLGDYVAGPSHVMPTEGTARFASPLSVADFVKRISLIALGPEEGQRLSAPAALLAEGEGLTAHAAAARVRWTPRVDSAAPRGGVAG
jgi:histidinol dehydrogenase